MATEHDDPTPRYVARSPKQRAIIIAAALGLIAVISLLVWLFSPGGSEPGPPIDLADVPFVDGTLVVVDPPRLVLRTSGDNQEEMAFTIREQDMGNFDVAHLRSHSSIGLPTRLYYLESEGKLFAVYKEDAPANSSRQDGS